MILCEKLQTGGISISVLFKIVDLVKDRRNPLWAPYQACRLNSEKISAQVGVDGELLFSLTVDVEHDFGISERSGSFKSFDEGTANLMRLFNQLGVSATFFVLKTVCDKFPKRVKEMDSRHEVGLHGYVHECWGKPKWWLKAQVLTSEQKRSYLAESIEALKEATSKAPKSFRAPYLVIDSESLKLLDEFKFEIDSSAPSYYGTPPKPYHPDGLSLLEIPISADPRPRPELAPLPHFRFDYLNTKLLTKRGVDWCINFVRNIASYQIERGIKPHVVMLTHQWEFTKIRKVPNKSFEYTTMDNEKLLHQFFSRLQKRFKVKFLPIKKLARVVA